MYGKEIKTVQTALALLSSEEDPTLMEDLKKEQAGAATGLEYYGITKVVLSRFLREKKLSNSTRTAIRKAVRAVVRMYSR